jgi:hypothetical protein
MSGYEGPNGCEFRKRVFLQVDVKRFALYTLKKAMRMHHSGSALDAQANCCSLNIKECGSGQRLEISTANG